VCAGLGKAGRVCLYDLEFTGRAQPTSPFGGEVDPLGSGEGAFIEASEGPSPGLLRNPTSPPKGEVAIAAASVIVPR